MIRNSSIRWAVPAAVLAVALCGFGVPAAWAGGGSRVSVDAPDAAATALAPGADLMVRVYNCGEASSASVDAHADGYVNGQRKTIALKLMKTSQKGVYGLARQWPASGRWVLSFTPKSSYPATTIVTVDGGSGATPAVRLADVKMVDTKMATKEVDACLKARSKV